MSDYSLSAYADELLGGEDELLRAIREEAVHAGIPSIQAPMEVGRLLQLLIVQSGARRALEIGTLFGYSAILMARALPANGSLITLEVNPTHAAVAQRNIRRANVADKVEIRVGLATETLAALAGLTFDLVFIDADKPSYPDYLRAALTLTAPGSFIVGDNVWRAGSVAHPEADDAGSAGIARFNQDLASNPSLLTIIVPTRGGADATSVSLVRLQNV